MCELAILAIPQSLGSMQPELRTGVFIQIRNKYGKDTNLD
jgi:hypothetical protein